MTLEQKIRKLQQRLPAILDGAAERLHDSLNDYIQTETDQKQRNPFTISKSKRIADQRTVDGLVGSFDKKSPDTLTDIKRVGAEIKGTFGTKVIYASVHEYGMFIKSKTKTSMFKGLMKKYYETKIDFYRGLAIKAREQGGIQIPARPYFEPAIKKFNSKGLSDWQQDLIDEIRAVWNE